MRNERDLSTDFFFIRSRTESVSGTGLNGDRDRRRPIFMDRRSRSGPVDRSSVGLCGFRTVRKSVSPISLLRDGRLFFLPLRFILLHHRLLSPSLSPCSSASRRFHLRLRRSLILAIFFPPTLRSSLLRKSFSISRARKKFSHAAREFLPSPPPFPPLLLHLLFSIRSSSSLSFSPPRTEELLSCGELLPPAREVLPLLYCVAFLPLSSLTSPFRCAPHSSL